MKNGKNIAFDTDHLLRYIQGDLSDAEVQRMDAALKQSHDLQQQLSKLRATQQLLQGAATDDAEDALAPFFTDRLMKKLTPEVIQADVRASVEDELALLLGRLFRPVAIAGFFLAFCLALYNINLSNDYSSEPTTTESILAMPPVTSITAYDLDFYVAENELLP